MEVEPLRTQAIGIQDNTCSNYDASKLYSFDVEFIDSPTLPLIHQKARFLYFIKGRGEIKVNESPFPIRSNSIVAILPWETSEITRVEEPLEFYKIIYDAGTVERAMRLGYNPEDEPVALLADLENTPVVCLNDEENEAVTRAALTLRDELGVESIYEPPRERSCKGVYVVDKLVELVVQYLRAVERSRQPEAPVRDDAPDNSRLIFKYLYTHLSQRLTLGKLSAALYMSESSISKYIAASTALSFNDVLTEMRLAKASDLLSHTGMTLSEVAQLCGFTDAPHLSKTFTAQTGLTANEYRKAVRRRTEFFPDREKDRAFEIIGYIHENYDDPALNIKAATARFGLSAKEVNRLLLFFVERNFEEFLNYLRVNHACQMLLTTRMTSLEVALGVGDNNGKTVDRNFIKLKGMTPGSFRRNTRLQVGGESIAKD